MAEKFLGLRMAEAWKVLDVEKFSSPTGLRKPRT
jgi:hypothetical protein